MLQFSTCIFPPNWFLLRGKTAKRKAEESLLQPKKKCVRVKGILFLLCGLLCCLFRRSFFCWHYLITPFHFTALKIILKKINL